MQAARWQATGRCAINASWGLDSGRYPDLVPSRGEVVGIDALSRTLFGSAAHGLQDREAAVAAVLKRAPTRGSALVAQRACRRCCRPMQQRQKRARGLRCAGAVHHRRMLQRRRLMPPEDMAPHFARYALRQQAEGASPTARWPTDTITAAAHHCARPAARFATQTLQQHLREPRWAECGRRRCAGAGQRPGAVLAWVGSSGALSPGQRGRWRALAAPAELHARSRFCNAQAIASSAHRWLRWWMTRRPRSPRPVACHIPQNYDRQFGAGYPVRRRCRVAQCAGGAHPGHGDARCLPSRHLGALGLPLRENGDYWLQPGLGSAGALLHLTNAFRSLANGGRFSPVVVLLASAPSVHPGAGCARCLHRGRHPVGRQCLRPHLWHRQCCATRRVGRETGTSKDMRDNWAAGWSENATPWACGWQCQRRCVHDERHQRGSAVSGYRDGLSHAREPVSRPPRPPQGWCDGLRFGPGGRWRQRHGLTPAGGCAHRVVCAGHAAVCVCYQ